MTLQMLLLTAFLTAVIHTITGPDHYLPFIAIAKSRSMSLRRTMLWTLVCGIGHILSALIIAIVFVYVSDLITEEYLEVIENNRSNIAAYTLIGLGGAYMFFALRHRYLHRHHIGHRLAQHDRRGQRSISVWVIFIIFVLGPCEALLPVLTAASVVGVDAVILSTVIFSVATIATMLLAVSFGYLGISALRFNRLEEYSHELAGSAVMCCGVAMLCGL